MNNDLIMWSPGMSLDQLEKEVILRALRYFHNNKTATSNSLKISPRTLDNKLAIYVEQDKQEKIARDNEKARLAEFNQRQRGTMPRNPLGIPYEPFTPENTKDQRDEHEHAKARKIQAAPPSILSTSSRTSLESSIEFTSQSTVPVPKQEEVQAVLPEPSSKGHSKKRSG